MWTFSLNRDRIKNVIGFILKVLCGVSPARLMPLFNINLLSGYQPPCLFRCDYVITLLVTCQQLFDRKLKHCLQSRLLSCINLLLSCC